MKFRSLKSRFIFVFCSFALTMSAIFAGLNFLVAYQVEDSLITRAMHDEANYLKNYYQQHQQWPHTRRSHYSLHLSLDSLPDSVKIPLQEEPNRQEFYGENELHYHILPLGHANTWLLAEVSKELVVRPLTRYVLIMLGIISAILAAIACIIAYRLAKRTLSPLTELSNMFSHADATNLPTGFAHRFPKNEIGILAEALDNAASRTEAFVERELQFTRDASHELRTPIAIVSGAAAILKKSDLAKGKQLDVLNRIVDANLQMEQTVQTLLTLAREENNPILSKPIKVLPILEKVILRASYILEGKEVDVKVNVEGDFELNTQESVLDIILWNLVSNAFQYTIQGQVIISNDEKSLIISDTGIGIEPDIQNTVCEPSVKGKQSQGFGIGLSIVKRLSEQQGIQLMIEHLAQGTRIKLS